MFHLGLSNKNRIVLNVASVFLLTSLPLLQGIAHSADTPHLAFSDITSGPSSGNTDPYGGGAIVTVWGENLGSSQGSSTITCGGVPANHVYYWGNADGKSNGQHADLYTRLQMQEISFSVGGGADSSGIVVTVNGVGSNTLPFTVRSGTIHFIKTTGTDSGSGTWSAPWQHIPYCDSHMAAGDITYACDGVATTTQDADGSGFEVNTAGTEASPKALIAYPGATVTITYGGSHGAIFFYYGDGNDCRWWVISKMYVNSTASQGIQASNFSYVGLDYAGLRIIGNRGYSPNCGMSDVGYFDFHIGGKLWIYGNELDTISNTVGSKLHHPLYLSDIRNGSVWSHSYGYYVGWNYIHDCASVDAINVYQESSPFGVMHDIYIHDNWLENDYGRSIMSRASQGDLFIYNNVVYNCGLNGASFETYLDIDTSYGGVPNPNTNVRVYNNTFYHPSTTESTAVSFVGTYEFKDNIIVPYSGKPYYSGATPTGGSGNYKNCFYGGSGSPPSWDTGKITSDPLFTNASAGDLSLKGDSPCRDAGLNTSSLVTQDIVGVLRPQGAAVDVGAFEYTDDGGGIKPPAAPTGLVIIQQQ
jgi:hypothetical protein